MSKEQSNVTPSEALWSALKTYGLDGEEHKKTIEKYLHPIFDAMDYYAGKAVNEQRELMSRHLNMRNVPRPQMLNE